MLLWMLACTTSTENPNGPETPPVPAEATEHKKPAESGVPFTSLKEAVDHRPTNIAVVITEDPEGTLRMELPSGAAVRGFKAETTATGGKRITLDGGPITQARWVTEKLEALTSDAKALEMLRGAGFTTYAERDLLEVRAKDDKTSTWFAFGKDNKVAGICSEVSILELSGTSSAFAVRKPVIYAYPERPTQLRIAVDPEGDFTTTYPHTDDGVWTVRANPRGVLTTDDGRRHRYLFWEADSTGFPIDRERAHLVPRAEAAGFLESVCDAFALTDFECGDFVTYWLPELQQHPYNIVTFPTERYEAWAPMHVDPRPDTLIRLFMAFEGSDKPVDVGAPPLPKLDRKGFTVVEWGGVEMR